MRGIFILRKLSLAVLVLICFFNNASGQIKINELCPSNVSVITNTNGKYDDWIELYNKGTGSVNLTGYGLTDDTTKKNKFTFPSYNLSAGGKVLVFTSGHNNSLLVDHWEMAVSSGTTWKYVSGSASIDTNWRNPGFNESGWSSGTGGIGFGDGDDNTTIPVGVSVMMRKTFTIPDTSKIFKGVFRMDYDDGFVAYLNGIEIARANIGIDGYRPLWDELASSGREASSFRGLPLDSFYISQSVLKSAIRQGSNVLAIEVHNSPANSDDLTSIPYLFFGMSSPGSTFSTIPSWFKVPPKDYFSANFKLSRTGEKIYLYNPSGSVHDQLTYSTVLSDNSYCRIPDGSSNLCYTNTPTPAASNYSSVCYLGYAMSPIFSKQGGYYNSTQTITLITTTPGGVIRYCTNGDTPNDSSQLYSAPITITSTTSLRARVFATGYLPSQTVTNTFIINGSTHLSSFSITTDSLNLWDYNTGIYVLGPNAASSSPYKGANFWQDWEKPATIEYFDKNKNLVVRFDADIRIYGNYSRAKPQKSFEIKLKSHYGTSSFSYPLIPDKSFITEIDDIVLRNSGTDWNLVHFRDAMMERIMKNTYTGYLATEPTIAYLNGEYWGVYHINENHDNHWMKNNFGYDKDHIDYLKESGAKIQIQEGSDASYWNLYNYATTQTPTTQQYYDYINSTLDLKNYTDYFVAETFYNNGDWIGDWTNNIQMWKPKSASAKWRYLLYDLDFGLGLGGAVTENRLAKARNPAAFSYSSEMFDAILKNQTYQRYFINRYADLMNTIFLPTNVNNVMHSYKDTMSYDMTSHFAKWGSSTSSWNSQINSMISFENSRIGKMKDFIKAEFSLQGIVTLTLDASPAGAGKIEISTIIPPSYPWTGDYFNGNPVTITAIPNPGYTFNHWNSTNTITSNNYSSSVTYNFSQNDQITAYFTGSPVTPKLCISEFNYNADSTYNSGDWIEVHNYGTTSLDISGWKLSDGNDNHKFLFPTGTTIAANGYLVVVEDSVKFKTLFPNVNNWIGLTGFNLNNSSDQVRLFDYQNNIYLSFYYQDIAPWPILPDGKGYTCELTSNTANPNDPSSWFAGCIGGSPGTAYSTSILIPVTITGSTTSCGSGNNFLMATYFQGSTYEWKKNGTTISGANDSTFLANQTGSYTVNISANGCSALTPPVLITTVSQQPVPVTTNASRCGAGPLTLTATSTDSVFWYDADIGGNQVGSGNTLSLPYLTQSKTYYARTAHICQSNSAPALAEIIQRAASPVSSDALECGPGIVTLTATDTAEIRWYNASTGGGLLKTGNSFTTNVIDNDTSFFIEAGSVCASPRIEVHVIINASAEPVVTDGSRCGNGTVTLSAAASAPVFWFNSQTGGSQLASGNIFTTPTLSVTDTFYAEANNGCPSVRVMGIASINPIPQDPIINDTVICSSGSITLTAIASEQVNWYTSSSGGQPIYTGTIFNTPVITSTTTYYASNGYLCQSNRVPVKITVSSPAPPMTSNINRCGSGSLTLNASSPELIYWYDAPSGGNLLGTGNSFTTPSISSTTTYYTETGNYCRSSRISVVASINTMPSIPVLTNASRCGNGSVTLIASSTAQVKWYTVPSGGSSIATGLSFTTPTLSSSKTYYVEAINGACATTRNSVQAIINPVPAAPTATGNSRCDTGTVNLMATASGPITWYNTATGGIAIASGSSYTTPILTASVIYYIETTDGICASGRTAISATIIPSPAIPVTGNVSRCNSGKITLIATSPEQIFWYSIPTGGNLLASGSSFTTPILTQTTTYYVETGNLCMSQRVPVEAQIVSPPAPPLLFDTIACSATSAVIRAVSASQVNWYDSPNGGAVIGTGLFFTTPIVNASTTFYANAGFGCNSSRIAVNVSILQSPQPPVTLDNSRCGTGALVLQASSPEQLYWFNSATDINQAGTGNNFITPTITTTTTYYVEAGNNCRSIRVPVVANIRSINISAVNDGSGCGSGSILLTATTNVIPDSIKWYDYPGGNIIGIGTSFTTPSISQTTTFYVTGNSLCSNSPIAAQAIIYPTPMLNLWPDTMNIPSGQSVTLFAGSGYLYYNWSTGDSTSLITASITGSYSVTVTNSFGCTESESVFIDMITSAKPIDPFEGIIVYPNPAREKIHIAVSDIESKKIILKLVSVEGRVIYLEEALHSNSTLFKTIDLTGIVAGIYYLEISNNNFMKTTKIIIQ